MNMEFFILALRFLEIWKKFKNAVALFPFRSYKEMQGKKLAEAVTFFVLMRTKVCNQDLKGNFYHENQRRTERPERGSRNRE